MKTLKHAVIFVLSVLVAGASLRADTFSGDKDPVGEVESVAGGKNFFKAFEGLAGNFFDMSFLCSAGGNGKSVNKVLPIPESDKNFVKIDEKIASGDTLKSFK